MKNDKRLFISGLSFDLFSRIVFILSGFSINIVLARILGAEKYGDVTIILSILTLLNVFLTNGVRQGLSRFIADPQLASSDIWRKSVLLQTTICVFLIGIAAIGVKPLSIYLKAPSLAKYFYLLLIVIPLNGLYYLQVGILNGLRRFRQQAIVTIIYSIARILIIFLFLFAFNMELGAVILGTAAAYFFAFLYGHFQWKADREGKKISLRELTGFSIQITILFSIIALFLNIDIIVIKNLEPERKLVGIYGAMVNVGRIAYFLLFSFSSTIFPIISNLKAREANEEIPLIIKDVLSAFFFLGTFFFMITTFFSDLLIQILYGTNYALAADYLPIYTLAMVFLSLMVFLSNILFIVQEKRLFIPLIFLFLVFEIMGIYFMFDHLGISSGPRMSLITLFSATVFLVILVGKIEKGSIPIRNIFIYFTTSILFYILGTSVIVKMELAVWVYCIVSVIFIMVYCGIGLIVSPGIIKRIRYFIGNKDVLNNSNKSCLL